MSKILLQIQQSTSDWAWEPWGACGFSLGQRCLSSQKHPKRTIIHPRLPPVLGWQNKLINWFYCSWKNLLVMMQIFWGRVRESEFPSIPVKNIAIYICMPKEKWCSVKLIFEQKPGESSHTKAALSASYRTTYSCLTLKQLRSQTQLPHLGNALKLLCGHRNSLPCTILTKILYQFNQKSRFALSHSTDVELSPLWGARKNPMYFYNVHLKKKNNLMPVGKLRWKLKVFFFLKSGEINTFFSKSHHC